MNDREAMKLQIVQRLGAPVLSSAITMAGANSGPSDIASRAAELMTSAVQLSLQLGRTLALKEESEGDADALRVVLASVAGGIVADLYRQNGHLPGEAEHRRLIPALDAVLTFADQFTPAPEMAGRMNAMTPGAPAFDENQAVVQYVQALVPAIQEISVFSFGLPERKLAQDVAERIAAQAEKLAADIFGSVTPSHKLGLMKALADLYAGCHRAEKNRLLAVADVTDSGMAQDSIAHLWAAFDMQAAMLGIFASAILPGALGAAQGAGAAAPVPPAPPPEAASQSAPLNNTENKTANPMAFFRPGAKKPPEDSDNGGSFAE